VQWFTHDVMYFWPGLITQINM